MDKVKNYKKAELSNGSKLYYVKNKISRTTMVDVVFYCGSRCDTIPGLAHFTEHMFFAGTKKLDKKEINKKYSDFINANAYTSSSAIVFTANVFTNEFENYLKTVTELVTESTFTQKAINDEVKIVNQEIAMYKDNFQMHAFYFNEYNLTKKEHNKYGNIGTAKTISTIKSKDVKEYVKNYFVKQNMDIFVASPLSFNKVKMIVERTLMKKIVSNPKMKKLPLYKTEVQDDSFFKIKTQAIGKDHLFMNFAFKDDTKNVQRRKQLELLLELMNNQTEGIMSDLRWGSNKNLTYGGRFYIIHGKDDSIITFNTQCDKENLTPIIETVVSYIKRVLKDGFKQSILDFEKREYKYEDDVKEPQVRAKFYKLTEYREFGKIYSRKLLRKYITDTTLEECNNLFHEIFDKPRASVSIYGDATAKDVLTEAQFKKLFK